MLRKQEEQLRTMERVGGNEEVADAESGGVFPCCDSWFFWSREFAHEFFDVKPNSRGKQTLFVITDDKIANNRSIRDVCRRDSYFVMTGRLKPALR